MMKYLITGLLVFGSCLLIQNAKAQSAQNDLASEGKIFRYNYSEQNFASNVPLNEVSSRAFKYFLKNFPDVKNEIWIRTETGFTAYFHDASKSIKLFFSPRGVFTYTEKSYGAEDLKPEVNILVSNRYPTYRVVTVREINDGYQYLYEVQISNNERTKMLTIQNKEIEVSNEYVN